MVRPVAPVRDKLVKVGLDDVAMFWIVLTTPEATEKLVELNSDRPKALVEASWIVTVEPTPVESAIVKAPVRVSSAVTPLPPPANPQLKSPPNRPFPPHSGS